MPPRPYLLFEANYRQLTSNRPNVAILPWGATEAHNFHLPHGTDVIEATTLAERAAAIAHAAGAKPIVLPAIPFGNNAQQLDQACTIHLSTATAGAILADVAQSLKTQGIDRLIILNAHGGNEFKPLARDVQARIGVLIVVINFFQMELAAQDHIFANNAGDHAGEMETSFLLHVCPELVQLEQAGPGKRVPFAIRELAQPGVWTPRPWSASHPDTGSGNPADATAEKGRQYVELISNAIARVIIALSGATKGHIPYL
jgi:creatinine amidohydrolase